MFFLFCFARVFATQPDSVKISRCYQYYLDSDFMDNSYSYTIDRFDSAGHLILTTVIGEINREYEEYVFINERTRYLWNNSGNLIYSLKEHRDSSGWKTESYHGYTYDNANNIKSDTLFFPPDSIVLTNYNWDPNHNTTLILNSYSYNGSSFIVTDSISMLRDINGRILVRYQQDKRETYSYDSFGNISSYTIDYLENQSYVTLYQYLYQYNASNLLQAFSRRENNQGDSLLHTEDTLYIVYNINNHPIEIMHKIGVDSSYKTITLGANDSLNSYDLYVNYNSGGAIYNKRMIVTRNGNGEVIDSTLQSLNNGTYYYGVKYAFDNSGLPLQKTMHKILCDSVSCSDTIEVTTYTYNAAGDFQTYDFHYYDHGDLTGQIDYGTFLDSLNRIVHSYYDDFNRGDQNHSESFWNYNAAGMNTYYYNSSSGSLGIPFITECFYEYFPDTGALHVQIYLDKDSVCNGTQIPAYILITGGSPPYQLAWNDTNGITDALSMTPIFFPTHTINYQLYVTDSNGQMDSAAVSMIIENINFSLGTDTTICTNNLLILNGPTGHNYIWYNGSSSQNLQIISLVQDTIIAWVEVTEINCMTRDSLIVIVAICPGTGIKENISEHFKIYNFNDNLQVVFNDDIADHYSIYDINGKMISSAVIHSKEIVIPTNYLSAGVYILNLGIESKWSEIVRIIIQK